VGFVNGEEGRANLSYGRTLEESLKRGNNIRGLHTLEKLTNVFIKKKKKKVFLMAQGVVNLGGRPLVRDG